MVNEFDEWEDEVFCEFSEGSVDSFTVNLHKENILKKIIEVTEDVGWDSLLGEQVLLICSAYFYTGKLTGVNDSFVQLENPKIVYETGAWSNKDYADAQKLHSDVWFVQRSAIESFGRSK
jgi:hypothetical protein